MIKHLVSIFVLSSVACRSSAESGEKYGREPEPRVFLEVFTEQADFFSSQSGSLDASSSSPSNSPSTPADSPVAPSIEPISTGDRGSYLRSPDSSESQEGRGTITPGSETVSHSESDSSSTRFYSESERLLVDPTEMVVVTDDSVMRKVKLFLGGVNPDCRLNPGAYLLSGMPQTILGMTYVTLARPVQGCPYLDGFVFNRDVRVVKALAPKVVEPQRTPLAPIVVGKKTACEFSWEEKPGTTDYTLWDSYLKRTYPSADRSKSESLQGANILQSGNSVSVMCGNAKILKNCFEKANMLASSDRLSIAFLDWARSRGISPVRLRMAIAMKETHLGGLSDSCSGSTCNGVGINQVITIVTDSGAATNSSTRPEWPGITHNILTNMKYGMRVLALKVRETQPQGIWDLAKQYNGSSTSASYASAVVKNYEALSSQCGL